MLADDPRLPKSHAHSPQNEVGQKIKIKKETKNFREESAPWGGSREGGKVSAHFQKCLCQAGTRGARQRGSFSQVSSEGNTATSAWKTKQREFTTEITVSQHFPAKN